MCLRTVKYIKVNFTNCTAILNTARTSNIVTSNNKVASVDL